MNFERRKDPLGALGIGRRKMIEDWLDEMEIYNYIINDDLTIDIDDKHSDSVDLMHKGFKELPVFIQFGNVGSFYISHNELQTLRGCPTYVQRTFSCQDNKLYSLDGCPKKVGETFKCGQNKKQFTEEYVRSLCDVKYVKLRY